MNAIKTFWSKHPIISNIILIFLVGVILLWIVLFFLDIWTMHGSTAIVPQIKQKTYAEAASTLQANDLSIEISDSIYDRNPAPGTVVESWPKAGPVVKKAVRCT